MGIRILILEDDSFRSRFFIERFGNHELKITENAQDAIEYLKENTFDYLFLDNDLGEGNGEGVDVAEFLRDNPDNSNNRAVTIIHSWNRPAAEKIKSCLTNAVTAPFNTESFSNLNLDI
jgi:ActR/RegA family two-component response regulator